MNKVLGIEEETQESDALEIYRAYHIKLGILRREFPTPRMLPVLQVNRDEF